MAHKHAEVFKKVTRAVLERNGTTDEEGFYASYDEGPLASMVSESPRLVATYRLVSVKLLVKRPRIVAIKQRRRKK